MLLMLKDRPVLDVRENGECRILEYDLLPFGLRRDTITYADFIEWASNRTLSVGRSHAKEILNTLRLSQNNRFAVCKACRGLNLEDAYRIRQEGDDAKWDEINLYRNPLSLFIAEISLSGTNLHFPPDAFPQTTVHTPELTTLGVSAKAWIRQEDGLYLHKIGKYEIPANGILQALRISHISYALSAENIIEPYLSQTRREWIGSVGEVMVCSALFTSEDRSLVTFEEFESYCLAHGQNPYEEARNIDEKSYDEMQLADYLLNNTDRHKQNWGFFMDNNSGKLSGYCPLFDHDQSFSSYENPLSQTVAAPLSLYEAARDAQRELRLDLSPLEDMPCPPFLSEDQWTQLRLRAQRL